MSLATVHLICIKCSEIRPEAGLLKICGVVHVWNTMEGNILFLLLNVKYCNIVQREDTFGTTNVHFCKRNATLERNN